MIIISKSPVCWCETNLVYIGTYLITKTVGTYYFTASFFTRRVQLMGQCTSEATTSEAIMERRFINGRQIKKRPSILVHEID